MVHADEGTGKKKEGHHEFANPIAPWQRDVAKSKGWTELCRSKHCYPLSLQCDARVCSGKHGARLDCLVEDVAQDLADLFH